MKKNYTTIIVPRRYKGEGERFFACNGRRYLIKCGVPVEVPVCVAEVYNNSLMQRAAAEEKISSLTVN